MRRIKTIDSTFVCQSGLAILLAALYWAPFATRAETLDIWVNPTTWAFDHVSCSSPGDCHDDPEDGSWTNVVSYAVSGTNTYGVLETRYYYAGGFTAVNIWNKDVPGQLLQSLDCNNIFYIKGTQAYALSVNQNGAGNDGTDGEVTALRSLFNGDLIIIGNFIGAGGYDHAYYFSCYEFKNGWLHAQGRNANTPLDTVRGGATATWESGYRLRISDGRLTSVNGPTYSGGPNVEVTVSNNTVWWYGGASFANGYWQTQ